MVKRCIGIDISPTCLSAVQIARAGEQFNIEKLFASQTRRSTDSPPEILRALFSEHGFDSHADVAVSMPHNAVFFHASKTDSDLARQACKRSIPAAENDFPIPADELVTQTCSQTQDVRTAAVVTAATAKPLLHERLQTLADAKIQPDVIDAAIFAVYSTALINHEEIKTGTAVIAVVDESHLAFAVSNDAGILIVRTLPIFSKPDDNFDYIQQHIADLFVQEMDVTWQKLFGDQIAQDTRVYLAGSGKLAEDIAPLIEESLHCKVIMIDPCANVKSPPEGDAGASVHVAEGLALRTLAPEQTTGVNFLDADNAELEPEPEIRKELAVCAALACAVVLAALVGLFVRLSRLESQYAKIKDETRHVFHLAVPEETTIANPLAQLDQKLQSLRADYAIYGPFGKAATGPLEVLGAVSITDPLKDGIYLDNMLVTTESVRLNGTAKTFESVYAWQQRLQQSPLFSAVDIKDINKGAGSEPVRFTILLSLKLRGQI